MQAKNFVFTSESVTEGHPDKICDQISDAVLDILIEADPNCRVACETMIKTGMVLIAGEITTSAYAHLPDVVRSVVRSVGYTDSSMGFDAETCAVLSAIVKQSKDISQGVTKGEGLHGEQGAGDQGMMFGFATNETKVFMPAPIHYASLLTRRLSEVRNSGELDFLRPDGKSQVSIRYEDGKPKAITTVVISSQHEESATHAQIKESIIETVIKPVLPADLLDAETAYHINPTGRFVIGGPFGDCGLTGRKIIVDTYGGWARHGGGAFSGKDPSKVDRSAAYAARYMAKNIVAAGLADQAEVQVAYAIGVAEPVSLMVTTFGTGKLADEKIAELTREHFPTKPADISSQLDLLKPIYRATSVGGHFGRDEDSFTWEKTDRAAALKDAAGF